MFGGRKTRITATLATMAVAVAVAAAPASAQPEQAGLINVAVTDNVVQIPVAVAANVCGVQVGVLASALNQGPVDCDADADGTADAVVQRGGGGGGSQQGLVNVWISDNTVQVPVGVAANVCDLQVAILAQGLNQTPGACDAAGNGSATSSPF
jgi:hypothetical protein